MKKQSKHILLALTTLVLAAVFLSSCLFGGGMSQEECIADFEANHMPRLTGYVAENEEVFNKVAESLSDYVIGLDDIQSYKSVRLYEDYFGDVKYVLSVSRQLNPDDEGTREEIDFINDSASNKFNLTEEDLDIVFAGYKEADCSSLSDDESRGNSIKFEAQHPEAMYNKNDRMDTWLSYSRSGGFSYAAGEPGYVNDHWYISSSLYWSPAI